MAQTIPTIWNALLIAFQGLAPPLIVAALWYAVTHSAIPAAHQVRVFALSSGIAVVWFLGALALSLTGIFATGHEELPVIQYAIVTPIVLALLLLLGTASGRAVVTALPLEWLIAAQVYRCLGAVFLVLYALGEFPGQFGVPAGVGDIIIGAAAPIVAVLYARHWRAAGPVARWWNYFGIFDLVIAVSTGFLTSPSVLQALAFDRPNELITAYPLAMVPAFLVPLSIVLHVICLWKLGRVSSDARTPMPALP